jgi:hypothetical protein
LLHRRTIRWTLPFALGLSFALLACGSDDASDDGSGSGGDASGGAGGSGGAPAQSSASSSSPSSATTSSTGGGAPAGPCADYGDLDQCCNTPWTVGKTCAAAGPNCSDVSNFAQGTGSKPDASKTGCAAGYECTSSDDDSPTGWHCNLPYSGDPSKWAPDCVDGACPAGHYCAFNFGGVCVKSCNLPKCPEGTTLATYPDGGEKIQECVIACE